MLFLYDLAVTIITPMNALPSFFTPEKQHISQSFSYSIPHVEFLPSSGQPARQEQQEHKLKDFSSRVKDSLKESQRRSAHEHGEDILVLKRSNVEMQAAIDQLRSKASSFRTQPHPQKNSEIQSSGRIKDSILKNSRREVSETEDASPSRAVLKRQVMAAINAAIQANDEKMCRQQKYVSELERRVAQLERLEGKVEALRFEREVKLQSSPKKAKNYSLRTPQVVGDMVEQPELSPRRGEGGKERHFFENPYIKNHSKQCASEQYSRLFKQNANLQEDRSLLKERLQIEVEAHAMATLDLAALQQKLEQLQRENKGLRSEVLALEGRLQFSQEKYADLEIFLHSQKSRVSGKILPNQGTSVSSELASIANELRMCGIDRFRGVERQIIENLIQKEVLRREVADLQAKIVEGCRFSCTHREVFQLKERVNELEKERRVLQQGEEGEGRAGESGGRKWKLECLQWPSLVHFCIASSLARLEDLQRQWKGAARP